jgi:hypothetical protein
MRRLAIILVILVSACDQQHASGNENTVTVTNASSALDGIVEATDWCLKYGKVPQHSESESTNGFNRQTYNCVRQ